MTRFRESALIKSYNFRKGNSNTWRTLPRDSHCATRIAISSTLESSGRAITRTKQWERRRDGRSRVMWGPVSVGTRHGIRLSSPVIPVRSRDAAGCMQRRGSVSAAAGPGGSGNSSSNLARSSQPRRSVRAGENTPRHAFPPSSSGFFGNLFGNARLRSRYRPPPSRALSAAMGPPRRPCAFRCRDRSKCC